jgi:uncharacterized protein YgbK (DUF1537 family)
MRDIAGGVRDPIAAIAVVADDLTGAADAGGAFAAAGLATAVIWSAGEIAAVLGEVDVVAIDAGTRARDAVHAAAQTGAIVATLRASGVETLYKKSDSLVRGHIGVEAAAVLDTWHPEAIGIVALAFPDAGRTTVGGRQYAHELAEGVAIAPLFEQAGLRAAGIDLNIVREGRLGDCLMAAQENHSRVVVCDATSRADLAAIVRAGAELPVPVVWVGSGGLARALASSRADRRDVRRHPVPRPSRRGPVMIVSGSASDVARAQVARVVASGIAALEIPASILRADCRREQQLMVGAILQHVDGGRDVAIFPNFPDQTIDPGVSRALGALLTPFGERVGGVVVTGGETASAVLGAWGITRLRIAGEIEPGVSIAIASGAFEIAVVTKPGAFGSPDVLVEARGKLHALLREAARTS